MARKPSEKKQQKPQTAVVPGKPRGQFFGEALAKRTLGTLLFCKDKERVAVSKAVIADLLAEMAPRDPLERMLVIQLALTHERINRLSRYVAVFTEWDYLMGANEQCERAMNTFRKGMLALKEYRSQPRGTPLVAVQQVNHATSGYTTVEAAPSEEEK